MSTKRTTVKSLADLGAVVQTGKLPQAAPTAARATDGLTKTKEAPGIVKRTSAYTADPRVIARKPGFNPRFDFGEIEELAKSIKANGLLQPLRVKRIPPTVLEDGKGPHGAQVFNFELIDGDRRLTAIEQLLGKGHVFEDGVDIIIVDKNQDEITSLIQMFEANTGKNFLPLEEAAAYKRLREAGLTIKQICEKVGRKQVHVVATLALLDADDDVKDAVRSGTVNSTTAKKIAVAARGDKAKQRELVAQAKAAGKDKVKGRAVKKAIDNTRRAKAAGKGKVLKIRALDDAELSAMGSDLALKMADRMRDAGMDLSADVRAWVAKDDKLALAFTFGALEALKAAAGVKIDLSI